MRQPLEEQMQDTEKRNAVALRAKQRDRTKTGPTRKRDKVRLAGLVAAQLSQGRVQVEVPKGDS